MLIKSPTGSSTRATYYRKRTVFLLWKTILYFKYTDSSTTYHSVTKKNDLPYQFKEIKEQSWYSIPFDDENRGNDVCSCLSTAAQSSDTSRSLLSPFAPASANCGQDGKNTQAKGRQNTRGKQRENSTRGKHFSFRKSNGITMTDPDQTACSAR